MRTFAVNSFWMFFGKVSVNSCLVGEETSLRIKPLGRSLMNMGYPIRPGNVDSSDVSNQLVDEYFKANL